MVTPPPGTPSNDAADGETRVASETTAPTALLGDKYRIERIIGEGAFGRVYLATDTRLRRSVAIKELLATRNATEPELFQRYLDRFGREARAGGAITHPNVVTVYEMEIDRFENTYLVMEYVNGTNLGALLDEVGTLPTERAVAIALDVARALEAVHEADIVHRDLKPANIMITRRGDAKLGDFGIAQVGTESQRTQVVMGHPGTPLYMSPEQSSGYGYLDGRSDLYSLGLVLYEMLAGEPYGRRRTPLAQAKPDTPPTLVGIVEQLMQRNPDQRYQTATDVITALSRLSLKPQSEADIAGYAFPPAPQPYISGPPSQTTGYPAAPDVPSAYGGPPSQGISIPPGSPPTGQYPTAPQPQTWTPYAPPGAGGYAPYGAPTAPYQPSPGGPAQKRGGIPAIAIIGIIAAVLIVAIGGIVLATRGGGSKTATATVGAGTSVARGATTTTTTGATATTASGSAATPAGNAPAGGTSTPSGTAVRSSSTAPAGTAIAGLSTARVGGGTPYPTASNQVKLTPGKPLPTAAGPNIYVDDQIRYTLHYPADWQQEPGDSSTDVQFASKGTTLAGITSSDLNGDPKPSAQQLADQVYGTFSKQLTNFKLTDASQVQVANQDGARLLYTFTDKSNTVTLGGYIVTFSTDSTIILFSGYASKSTFDPLVSTFDSVAGSFTGGVALDNTYTDPQSRFTFDYPAGWTEGKPSGLVVAIVAANAGTPSFNVVIENSGTRTLQQYYDANVRTLADPSSSVKSYKKVSESDTTISGQPAKLQVYTADYGGAGTILEVHQWFIVVGGKGYVLTYVVPADKAKDFAGAGPIIAHSFTLT